LNFRKALLCAVLLLAGCVPTIPYGMVHEYDREVYESLRPGEATRADVLLTIGEPLYRFEEDRFFMYEWLVVYAFGVIPPAVAFPVYAPHYLCLEFAPDSCLVRREHFIGSIYGKPEKAIQKCTLMNQPKETP